MAGLWLCTNGCRSVDGGRTSPVTVLISGCGHGGQLHDSAPTGGHDAFADNSASLAAPWEGRKEKERRGAEGENPQTLNMNLVRKAPFVIAGARVPIEQNAPAWQGNWLQKFAEFE